MRCWAALLARISREYSPGARLSAFGVLLSPALLLLCMSALLGMPAIAQAPQSISLFQIVQSGSAGGASTTHARRTERKKRGEVLVQIRKLEQKLSGRTPLSLTVDGKKLLFDPKSMRSDALSEVANDNSFSGELRNASGAGLAGDMSFKLTKKGAKALLSARIGFLDGRIFSLEKKGKKKDLYALKELVNGAAPEISDMMTVTFHRKGLAGGGSATAAGGAEVTGAQSEIIRAMGGTFLYSINDEIAVAKLDKQRAASISGGVSSVAPVVLGTFAGAIQPNDDYYSRQWSLNNTGGLIDGLTGLADVDIDAPEGWSLNKGSAGVIVAMIDSGVNYQHTDLQPNMWRNPYDGVGGALDDDGNGFRDDYVGWDFSTCDERRISNGICLDGSSRSEDNDPMDEVGHGTLMAGIIGARGNNVTGITGVNWEVTMLPVRIGTRQGYVTDAEFVRAVQYVVDLKRFHPELNIKVINAALGFDRSCSDAVRLVLGRAKRAGMLVVTAAGNRGKKLKDSFHFMPAECANECVNENTPDHRCTGTSQDDTILDNVISVTAVNQFGELIPGLSNYGKATVHIAAPGAAVISTSSNGAFEKISGTSAAAAHVSGAAALLYAQAAAAGDGTLTPQAVRELLIKNSKRSPRCQHGLNVCDDTTAGTRGGGILSVGRALEAYAHGDGSQPPPPPGPTATATPQQPTVTPVATWTPHGPVATPTRTPVFTSTPGGPAATPTRTPTAVPPMATSTPTRTPLPGTPTVTPTATSTPGPIGVVQLRQNGCMYGNLVTVTLTSTSSGVDLSTATQVTVKGVAVPFVRNGPSRIDFNIRTSYDAAGRVEVRFPNGSYMVSDRDTYWCMV